MIKIVTGMTSIDGRRINNLTHPLIDADHKVIKNMLKYATKFELRLGEGDYRIYYGDKYELHVDFDWEYQVIRVLECIGEEENRHTFKGVDELDFFYRYNILKAKEAVEAYPEFKPLTEYFPFNEIVKISRWYDVHCDVINRDGRIVYEYWFDDIYEDCGRMVSVTKFSDDELYYVIPLSYEEASEEDKILQDHMIDRDEVYYSMAKKVSRDDLIPLLRENL